jgi:adenosylhomocysteine nucleosidase
MVFRRTLHSWLLRTAGEKMREQMAEAAREGIEARRPGCEEAPDDPAGEACDVGLVFALGIEAGGLEDLLDGASVTRGYGFTARQGTLAGRRVVIVLSGPGRAKAARATEALLAGHHPRWVVSAGLAGGLDPDLKRRDVVLADSVRLLDGEAIALAALPELDQWADAEGIRRGALLTVDHVVRHADKKQSLGRQTGAAAVDMESYAVAEVCRRQGVPILAVRAIVDAAGDELPGDVERLLDQPTAAAKLGAALGSIWRRPAAALDLWNLKENALLASDRLAKFLATLIRKLPAD